jgi:hypothetical protein
VAWYDGNDEIVLHISAYSVCMIIIPDKLMQKQIKRKPYMQGGANLMSSRGGGTTLLQCV